jgi:6-phosphogluconolactonase
MGTMPISLTIYKNWVYVLDAGGSGNIAGFMLSNTGALTYLAGSNQPLSGMANPSPEQIGFNPDGNVLVVTEEGTNTIDTYIVGPDGIAENPATFTSIGGGPYGFAFTGENNLIVTEAATNTLSSYVLSDMGTLRTISGAMPTFGNAPCWVAINDMGSFAYTSNAHGGTISTFSISGTGGLNLLSSKEAQLNIPTLDLAFSKHSQFLYALNGGSITGFKVFNDGSLWQVTSVSSVPASASGLTAT